MSITMEQAEYLISMPKKIVEKQETLIEINIEQCVPYNKNFDLFSDIDDEYNFLWSIKQSEKNILKISLHLQENDNKIALLRIDFTNSSHKNPEICNEFVPDRLKDYAGLILQEPHIHYYVYGYNYIVWAIPLTADNFEIKTINENDLNNSIINIIKAFSKIINLETKINFTEVLL